MLEKEERKSTPSMESARVLAVTLQPGSPDDTIVKSLVEAVNTKRVDYLIFIGPGSALLSDWPGYDVSKLYHAAVENKIPTFWVTDAIIPPSRLPIQYERGVKFDYGNHPGHVGGHSFCAYLLGMSFLTLPEMVADLQAFHRADPKSAFSKVVEKYGPRNEKAIARAELYLDETTFAWAKTRTE